MKKIAVYGKGGIGKSTTVSNMSVALSSMGYKVMQIGCDPKADSTRNLTGGRPIPTVLSVLREKPNADLSELVHEGCNGIHCVETGGPTPGLGCAGRGIITAFEKLEESNAFDILKPDVVFYDVLGDVVCGGFAMPIRNGYAQDVYVVTSGEAMSLFAARNIFSAVEQFKSRGYATFSGLILNARGLEDEGELVQAAASELATTVVGKIPRHSVIHESEKIGKTVVESFPQHAMTAHYTRLAEAIVRKKNNEIRL